MAQHMATSITLLVLFAFASTRTSGKNLPYTDCASDQAKSSLSINRIVQTPDRVSIPGEVTAVVEGKALRGISGGTYKIRVGIKIFWTVVKVWELKGDLCDKLTHSASCPISAGERLRIRLYMHIPFFTPRKKVYIHAEAWDEQRRKIACLKGVVDLRRSRKAIS
ncbi:hypothetical protein BSKO_04932 [Bryopsis sp. KO-2023]|nr:hypothetical protein BSKO_04932 [Bryopsis sp. KO-2023]